MLFSPIYINVKKEKKMPIYVGRSSKYVILDDNQLNALFLNVFISCLYMFRAAMLQNYTFDHLKEFLDMYGVDFYHRITFTNLIIARHTVPARCKHVATSRNMWPGHHITTIRFHKLLMNNDCRYFQ